MKKIGIYKIVNIITNKCYIGSSNNIDVRFNTHIHSLKNNKHHSIKLQNSYNKHGIDNFIFEVIEFCDIESLLKKEQYYIDFFNSYHNGYNCSMDSSNPMLGRKHSEKTKKLMSENNKGENHHFYGKKLSIEHKDKISKAGTGRVHSEKTKKQIGKSQKGKVISEEQKKLISLNNTGRPCSEETKLKISEAMKGDKNPFYGRTHSIENLIKISIKNKGKKHSCETKEKMKISASKKDKTFYNTPERINNLKKCMVGNTYGNKKIVQIDNNGVEIKIWDSLKECSKFLKIDSSGISAVLSGKQKTTKGYKFKYYTNNIN